MFSCRKATILALADCDRPLTHGERLRLAIHRVFCAPCRIYQRQLAIMREFSARLGANAGDADVRLTSDARARLRTRLRAARDDP